MQVGGLSIEIRCVPTFLGIVPAAENSFVLSIGVGQGGGGGVDGGWNVSCWMVRRLVCALWCLVCHLRMRLMVP